MNIEISAKEYRDLLDILHIADVVLSGHRRGADPRSVRHHALIHRLYSLAKGEGLDHLIRYNEGEKVYAPTDEFEQNTLAHVAVNEFGEHLFWDELINRLTERDAARHAGGRDRLNALSDSDRLAVEGPIRHRYMQEFSSKGIANLAVIEGFSNIGSEPVRTSD
ncbi:MAG TPA: hypothetical protein VL197_06945 [Nitrospirota bacterium]|nr:hypothetical protein [Nitrospirota bacterium]